MENLTRFRRKSCAMPLSASSNLVKKTSGFSPFLMVGGEMVAEDEEAGETNGVSIGSPSGDNIYDALYEVLRQTNSVMTWSFGGCAVANASVIADLPKELIEENGKPIIVGSGWEILAAIEAY